MKLIKEEYIELMRYNKFYIYKINKLKSADEVSRLEAEFYHSSTNSNPQSLFVFQPNQ